MSPGPIPADGACWTLWDPEGPTAVLQAQSFRHSTSCDVIDRHHSYRHGAYVTIWRTHGPPADR